LIAAWQAPELVAQFTLSNPIENGDAGASLHQERTLEKYVEAVNTDRQ
jgi:hypothetical protein